MQGFDAIYVTRNLRDLREKRNERDGESSKSEIRGFQNVEPRTSNLMSRLSRTSCLSRVPFTRKCGASAITAEALHAGSVDLCRTETYNSADLIANPAVFRQDYDTNENYWNGLVSP
jgi:hypothetical protein